MGKIWILLLALGVTAFGFPSAPQTVSIEETLKKAEEKIAATVAALEEMPEEINLFFARAKTQLDEQQDLAEARMGTIQKLLKTGGVGSPEYGRILQLTTEILVQAPDTKAARTAHWNIHAYFLAVHNPQGAKDALMTYLHKYDAEPLMLKEAFDKLANLAADEKEWDLALYYSEKCLEIELGSPPVLLNKARALVNLGFLPEGKALLQRIEKENPGSAEAALAGSALKELEQADFTPDLLFGYRKTMELMRKIAAAAAMYHVEHMTYPRTVKDLYPVFLEELTEKDAWGGAFILKYDTERNKFLVASGGSDGVFNGFDQEGFYVDLPGKDIIFSNGAFIYAPRLKTP
ncbi:MAG: hypothetical protein WBC70_16070 [Candidatus Aminicenantales bacterium]